MENEQLQSQNKIQFKRNTKNFSKQDFILDYLNIDWEAELEIGKNDVNHSTGKSFSNINAITDKHMPVRKLTTKECKQKIKPWITLKIIANKYKNKLYKNS